MIAASTGEIEAIAPALGYKSGFGFSNAFIQLLIAAICIPRFGQRR